MNDEGISVCGVLFSTDDVPRFSPAKVIRYCEAGLPPTREPPRNESVLFDKGRDWVCGLANSTFRKCPGWKNYLPEVGLQFQADCWSPMRVAKGFCMTR